MALWSEKTPKRSVTMELKISDHINYISEEMNLLISLADPEGYPAVLAQCRKKLEKTIDSPALFHRFDVVENIIKEGRRILKKDMDLIKKYFRPYSNDYLCLADVVLLFTRWDWEETADTLEAYVRRQTPQERNYRFISLNLEQFNDDSDISFDHTVTMKQISSWLDDCPLSPEDKWQLFSAFIQWDKHIGPIVQLMKKAEKVLEKTKEQWLPLLHNFYTYWRKQCREKDVLGDIRTFFHIDLHTGSDKSILIAPNMIFMNSIGFYVTEDNRPPAYDYYSIGILYGEELYLDFNIKASSEKEMSDNLHFLKLLSDKSKLEIMMSIKDEPAYGAQLARKMNLTTATISYHMGALIQNGLVSLKKVNNRLYYSVNQDKIKNILNNLEDLLL